MSSWLNLSTTSNKFRQSYFKGFVDISGGGLNIRSDASLNIFDLSNLSTPNFSIKSDKMKIYSPGLNSTVDVSNDRLIYLKNVTYDISNTFTNINSQIAGINSDASNNAIINNRLFVNNDVSLNGNLTVANVITCSELIITNTDTSGGVLFCDIVTASGGIISNNDVSLNNRLYVGLDTTMNKRLFIQNDTSLNGNLFVSNFSILNNITQYITPVTYSSSPGINISFTGGSTVYYTVPTAATNFKINFTNIPTVLNQSFSCTVLINTSSYRCYCNTITVNGTAATLICNGGIANVTLGSCTFLKQTMNFINAGGSAPLVVLTDFSFYQ